MLQLIYLRICDYLHFVLLFAMLLIYSLRSLGCGGVLFASSGLCCLGGLPHLSTFSICAVTPSSSSIICFTTAISFCVSVSLIPEITRFSLIFCSSFFSSISALLCFIFSCYSLWCNNSHL